MASSSLQRGGSREPPPPDQLASLYKLVDKVVMAGVLCRFARCVELSAQAAVHAEGLFGDDSLVVASMRTTECQSLTNIGLYASGAEKEALTRRAWAALLSVINILLRRLEANTLLPGTVRVEEIDYDAHVQATLCEAKNEAVPPQSGLRALASIIGYGILLKAMYGSLELLLAPFWPTVQKRMVESFVLRGLDVIPLTAGIPANNIGGECDLVSAITRGMKPRNFGSAFCTAFLRKWRSNAVSSVLRARGVLKSGAANSEHEKEEFQARCRADVATHGLRDCAFPSCDKTEKTVKEFSLCAGCRSQVYCCLEHQALDWKTYKKECKEKEAARRAEEEADNEETGGAAAPPRSLEFARPQQVGRAPAGGGAKKEGRCSPRRSHTRAS